MERGGRRTNGTELFDHLADTRGEGGGGETDVAGHGAEEESL
jgi:hypothetical protein